MRFFCGALVLLALIVVRHSLSLTLASPLIPIVTRQVSAAEVEDATRGVQAEHAAQQALQDVKEALQALPRLRKALAEAGSAPRHSTAQCQPRSTPPPPPLLPASGEDALLLPPLSRA